VTATRLPRLHVFTDTRPGADPVPIATAALAAGARLLQIRVGDHYTDRAAYDLALTLAALCADHDARSLVNDRVHIAQAVAADGVHVGADDHPRGECEPDRSEGQWPE
jgi:thiamine-phosphate pyrophosphorylase